MIRQQPTVFGVDGGGLGDDITVASDQHGNVHAVARPTTVEPLTAREFNLAVLRRDPTLSPRLPFADLTGQTAWSRPEQALVTAALLLSGAVFLRRQLRLFRAQLAEPALRSAILQKRWRLLNPDPAVTISSPVVVRTNTVARRGEAASLSPKGHCQ